MITWIISLLVGAIGGHSIARFQIRRSRKKKLAALDLMEAALPTEAPEICPKCGYAGRTAKAGEPYTLPDQPAFSKGYHIGRYVSVNSPEHLSCFCYECHFSVMTSTRRGLDG